MLGKLIKYEFKACSRVFFPIYIGILILAVINGLFNNYNIFKLEDGGFSFSIENMQGVLMLVLFALYVALFVLTITFTIQRFKKSLLEEEGYLMFTLPVSSKSIILSKYLVSLVFVILSTIVASISFVIVGLFSGNLVISDIPNIFTVGIRNMFSSADFWTFTLIMSFAFILMYSIFIFSIYLAISVGQFPKFNKHRIASGVIAFFVINVVVTYLQRLINNYAIKYDVSTQVTGGIIFNISTYDVISALLNILIVVALFMGTDWILNKKLNLE